MALHKFTEDFALALPTFNPDKLARATEALITEGDTGKQGLEVKFAAIHEGLTRNNTFYTKQGLTNKEKNDQGQIGGLESWTKPYNAPVLLNHDTTVDPIGRVQKAEWVEKGGGENGHVELTALITHPEAIQKFLRGEYQTGSIGMDVDRAECSVCGIDKMESYCYHERGKWYTKAPKGHEREGEWLEAKPHEKGARRAHIAIGNVWAREYSVVNVPSDMRSKVKSMQVIESVFTEASGEAISLLEAPVAAAAVTESTENTPENTPEITEKSVAELSQCFRTGLESDVLSLYTAVISELAIADIRPEGYVHALTVGEGEQERGMLKGELEKFAAYIFENNEDLENELNEIKEAVLSSTSTSDLPDSAFALVKTVGEHTLRALPFKDASGKVVPEKLITAISRWNQLAGFTHAESAKGLKKLRTAALKRGFGAASDEEKAAEIQAATEFLKANGLFVAESAPTGDEELKTRLATLESENKDLRTLVSEREVENEELVEQVAEHLNQIKALNTAVEDTKKSAIIEKIVLLEEVAEDAREARVAELTAESAEKLTGVLQTLEAEKPEGVYVVQRISKSALAGAANENEVDKTVSVEMADVIGAFLGSKRAKEKVTEALKPVISK